MALQSCEVWRIEGLSWLENTLKQNGLCTAALMAVSGS